MPQMKCVVHLDTVEYTCPCGSTINNQGAAITSWLKQHTPHTDGSCEEEVSNDGAKCLVSKPEKRIISLI
jgi:hypothetical protein